MRDRPLRSLVVVYRKGAGVDVWRSRNQASPVPGGWPYGLDELESPDLILSAQDVAEAHGVRGSVMRAVGRTRSRQSAGLPEVALCWDELTAPAMLAQTRAVRRYSGIIWATDTAQRMPADAAAERTAAVLRQLDGLWVLSRPQIQVVRSWLGDECPPVSFLRFGIDTEFYAQRPYPAVPHIVSAGGDRDRDPETLFAALQIVLDRRPGVRCTVQTTSTLSPPKGVRVVPRLRHIEMAELLTSATVVAIATRPNLHASAMTVGLEAMSVGRPVVVCDTPGMREDYFEEGITSFLVPTSDPEAMADRIGRLLDDRIAAAAMGSRAAMVARSRHSTGTMCAELRRIVGVAS